MLNWSWIVSEVYRLNCWLTYDLVSDWASYGLITRITYITPADILDKIVHVVAI